MYIGYCFSRSWFLCHRRSKIQRVMHNVRTAWDPNTWNLTKIKILQKWKFHDSLTILSSPEKSSAIYTRDSSVVFLWVIPSSDGTRCSNLCVPLFSSRCAKEVKENGNISAITDFFNDTSQICEKKCFVWMTNQRFCIVVLSDKSVGPGVRNNAKKSTHFFIAR